MGNEILAIILWIISIPVVLVILWIAVFFGFLKGAKRTMTRFDTAGSVGDFLKAYIVTFWPALLAWLIGVIWIIVAVVNAIVHLVAAINMGVNA